MTINYNDIIAEIYIEATILDFGQEDTQLLKKADEQGGIGCGAISGLGEGRLIMKIDEKFNRFEKDRPNLLLVYKASCLPFRGDAIFAMKHYFESLDDIEKKKHFAGIFYFDTYNMIDFVWNPRVQEFSKIDDEHIKSVWKALEDLS